MTGADRVHRITSTSMRTRKRPMPGFSPPGAAGALQSALSCAILMTVLVILYACLLTYAPCKARWFNVATTSCDSGAYACVQPKGDIYSFIYPSNFSSHSSPRVIMCSDFSRYRHVSCAHDLATTLAQHPGADFLTEMVGYVEMEGKAKRPLY